MNKKILWGLLAGLLIVALPLASAQIVPDYVSAGSYTYLNAPLPYSACTIPVTITADLTAYHWRAASWSVGPAVSGGLQYATCSVMSSDAEHAIVQCTRTSYCDVGHANSGYNIAIKINWVMESGASCTPLYWDEPFVGSSIISRHLQFICSDGKSLQCFNGDYIEINDCIANGLSCDLGIHQPASYKIPCKTGCMLNGILYSDGGHVCTDGVNIKRCNGTTGQFEQFTDCATKYNSICITTGKNNDWCMNTWDVKCPYQTTYSGTSISGTRHLNDIVCANPEGTGYGIYKCTANNVWTKQQSCVTGTCLTSEICTAPAPHPPNPNPLTHFSWLTDIFASWINDLKSSVCSTFGVWCV